MSVSLMTLLCVRNSTFLKIDATNYPNDYSLIRTSSPCTIPSTQGGYYDYSHNEVLNRFPGISDIYTGDERWRCSYGVYPTKLSNQTATTVRDNFSNTAVYFLPIYESTKRKVFVVDCIAGFNSPQSPTNFLNSQVFFADNPTSRGLKYFGADVFTQSTTRPYMEKTTNSNGLKCFTLRIPSGVSSSVFGSSTMVSSSSTATVGIAIIGHFEEHTPTVHQILLNCEGCTVSNEQTEINEGESYTVTLIPDGGSIFVDPPTYCYGDNEYIAEVDSDGTCTITIDNVADDIMINAYTEPAPEPTTHNITGVYNNCTSSNSATEIEDENNYTNTITPNNGYRFNSAPTYNYNGSDYTATINSDGTATINIDNVQGDITISATAELIPLITHYSITNQLTDCTTNNSTVSVEENSSYTAILTPAENKEFSEIPTYTHNGETLSAVINENGTATINIGAVLSDVIINAVATTIVHAYSINIEQIFNCKLYDGDNEFTENVIYDNRQYYFKLVANDNFYFKIAPTYTCGGLHGQFTLSSGKTKISSIWWNNYKYITPTGNLTIIASATPNINKYGFISVFNPTYDELEQLAKKRFMQYNGSSTEYVDCSEYIISLKKLYINIDQISREIVYFGRYSTNIDCNVIYDKFIEIDCGSVNIPTTYNNSTDLKSSVELWLPFIGKQSLLASDCVGKTISLKYRINPIDGSCVAIVSQEGRDIETAQGNVSFEVPVNFKNGSLNNSSISDNPLYMANLTPYIECRTPIEYGNPPTDAMNNNIWVKVSDCTGKVVFSDFRFAPTAQIDKDIIDEIENLMTNGVIV